VQRIGRPRIVLVQRDDGAVETVRQKRIAHRAGLERCKHLRIAFVGCLRENRRVLGFADEMEQLRAAP